MVDIRNLTRFPILDLKEELTNNRVKSGKHSEIINYFKKHLDDTEFYCISQNNPLQKNITFGRCNNISRTFKTGEYSNYFITAPCEVEGLKTNAVVQEIEPKTATQFHLAKDFRVVYLSKKAVDIYLSKCEGQ
jgi:hypothetical protein